MARHKNAAKLSPSGPGLVEKKILSERKSPKSRTSGSALVQRRLQSGCVLMMVGTTGIHFYRSESENLHAGSDSFSPPTTQPPKSDDDKSSQSRQSRHQDRDNSSASAES
eukprot:1581819-Ditylum_brightwellii.AAC.1